MLFEHLVVHPQSVEECEIKNVLSYVEFKLISFNVILTQCYGALKHTKRKFHFFLLQGKKILPLFNVCKMLAFLD